MSTDKKLTKKELDDKLLYLMHTANQSGYVYDDGEFVRNKEEDDKVFVLNIRGCTLGRGESLGNYKVYDKTFEIDKSNFINTISSIKESSELDLEVIESILMWSDSVQCDISEYRFIDTILIDFYHNQKDDKAMDIRYYLNYDTKPLEDDSVLQDCYLSFIIFGGQYNVEIQVLEIDEEHYDYNKNVYFQSKPINGSC